MQTFAVCFARDFHSEADEALSIKDTAFQPQLVSFWQENAAPAKSDAAFSKADAALTTLNQSAREAAWQRDNLVLARDLALLGQLMQDETKSQRSERQQRILHVRSQNLIGASIVNNFMTTNAAFFSGTAHEITSRLDKAEFSCCFIFPVVVFRFRGCLIILIF